MDSEVERHHKKETGERQVGGERGKKVGEGHSNFH